MNQVELSLRHAGLIESGVQVNRGAAPADAGAEGLLEFCWEQGIDVQAWAPFAQGRPAAPALNVAVNEIASRYSVEPETILIAWLLRHPARIRPIIGSARPSRIRAAFHATRVRLSREDWYRLLNTARQGDLP